MKTRFLFCLIALFMPLVGINAAQSTGDLLLGDNNQFWTLPATECDGDNFCEVRVSSQGILYSWDSTHRKLYVSQVNQNTYATYDLSSYSSDLGANVDFVPFDTEGYVAFLSQFGGFAYTLARYSLNSGTWETIEFPDGSRAIACNRYTGILQRTARFIFQIGTAGRILVCSGSPQHQPQIHIININTLEIEQTLNITTSYRDSQPAWSVGAGLDSKVYVQIPNPETFMHNLPQIDEATHLIIFVYDLTTSVWSYKLMPKGINTVILTALPNDEGIFFNNHPLSNQIVQFDSDFQIVRRFELNLGIYIGITLNGNLFYRTGINYSDIQIMNINDYPLLTQYPENNLADGN